MTILSRFKDGINVSLESLNLLWRNKKLFLYRAIPTAILFITTNHFFRILGIDFGVPALMTPLFKIPLAFIACYTLYPLSYNVGMINKKQKSSAMQAIKQSIGKSFIFVSLGMFIQIMLDTPRFMIKFSILAPSLVSTFFWLTNILYYCLFIAFSFVIPATVLKKQSIYGTILDALKTTKKSVFELIGLTTIVAIIFKHSGFLCVAIANLPFISIISPILLFTAMLIAIVVPITFWVTGITLLYQKKKLSN